MKLKTLTLIFLLIITLTSCSSDKAKENKTTNEIKVEEKSTEKKSEIIEVEEMGEGIVYLSGVEGTTENGETLKILIDQDAQLQQIGLNTDRIDGNHISYIYLDQELFDKIQLGDSQTTLELTREKGLKEGIHQIIVKQYDNDEETGKEILIKQMKYEILINK